MAISDEKLTRYPIKKNESGESIYFKNRRWKFRNQNQESEVYQQFMFRIYFIFLFGLLLCQQHDAFLHDTANFSEHCQSFSAILKNAYKCECFEQKFA